MLQLQFHKTGKGLISHVFRHVDRAFLDCIVKAAGTGVLLAPARSGAVVVHDVPVRGLEDSG